LQQLDSEQNSWQQTGAMQLPSSARIKKQIVEYPQSAALAQAVDAQTASRLAGIEISETVHYYPLAVNLQPLRVLQYLIDDLGDALSLRYQTQVESFFRSNDQCQLFYKDAELIS